MERPVEAIVDRHLENKECGSRLEKFYKLLTPREFSIFLTLGSQDGEFNTEDLAKHLEISQESISMTIKRMRAKASAVFGSEEIETRKIKRGRK